MARIMIIDDQELVCDAMAIVLEKENHEVQKVGCGRTAVGLCENNPPAVVITDILMPGMDGFEVIRELRRASPSTKIIALSGGGHMPSQDLLQMASRMGADAAFRKPIDVPEFLAAVSGLLVGCTGHCPKQSSDYQHATRWCVPSKR